MSVAISVFGISLVGIAALFALKYKEQKSGEVYAPTLRSYADAKAVELKRSIERLRKDLELLPPFLLLLGRKGLHETALLLAALARHGEDQAHRLADYVSPKHRFERRAPRSEFLMRVSRRDEVEEVMSTPVVQDSVRADEPQVIMGGEIKKLEPIHAPAPEEKHELPTVAVTEEEEVRSNIVQDESRWPEEIRADVRTAPFVPVSAPKKRSAHKRKKKKKLDTSAQTRHNMLAQ